MCANYDIPSDEIMLYCNNIKACGAIILQGIRDYSALRELDKNLPLVVCCDSSPLVCVTSISIDDYACGRKLTNYLLTIGRKRIGMINVVGYPYGERRERGFRDVMYENSVEVNEQLIIHLKSITYESSYVAALNLLSTSDRPDAIFAVSDTVAVATTSAAKSLGLEVPKDISVVGVDNTLLSQINSPSITTVSQPSYSMGSLACEMLINEVNNPGAKKTLITQDFELIIRESS